VSSPPPLSERGEERRFSKRKGLTSRHDSPEKKERYQLLSLKTKKDPELGLRQMRCALVWPEVREGFDRRQREEGEGSRQAGFPKGPRRGSLGLHYYDVCHDPKKKAEGQARRPTKKRDALRGKRKLKSVRNFIRFLFPPPPTPPKRRSYYNQGEQEGEEERCAKGVCPESKGGGYLKLLLRRRVSEKEGQNPSIERTDGELSRQEKEKEEKKPASPRNGKFVYVASPICKTGKKEQ